MPLEPLLISAQIADHFCACGQKDCRHVLFIDERVRPLVDLLRSIWKWDADEAMFHKRPGLPIELTHALDAALKDAGVE